MKKLERKKAQKNRNKMLTKKDKNSIIQKLKKAKKKHIEK